MRSESKPMAVTREFNGILYVIVDETENPKDFLNWLNGQTMPVIPDAPTCAYAWDYERYLDERLIGKSRIPWD